MKSIYLILLIFASNICYSQYKNAIKQTTSNFLEDPELQNSFSAISIYDTNKKEYIISHNIEKRMLCASVMKLISTSTGLLTLGAEYRFKTKIEITGKIKNNSLYGDIKIKGGGDPTLGSRYFKNNNFISFFRKILLENEIKTIKGSIIYDDTYFRVDIPDSWIWEDIGNYYGSIPNALSFGDNMFDIYLKSSSVGSKTEILGTKPKNIGINFQNEVFASSVKKDLAYVYGSPFSKTRLIKGSIPANRSRFRVKASMFDPKIKLIKTIENTLEEMNIAVYKKNIKTETLLKQYNFYSPKLEEISKITNKKSINLFADHIFLEIIKNNKGKVDWSTASNFIKEFWKTKGINTNHIAIKDGSGLSRLNYLNIQFINQVLEYMYNNKPMFMSQLSIAGIDGSLKYINSKSNLVSNLYAKTGYINSVRAICGYLKTKSGRILQVCIVVNNHNLKFTAINNKLLRYLEKIQINY
ncbi:MAG: D-alanyl-D-alanine carboxypeptidase/D-alanyl-D-alanine-endopeptidase [Marinifilaceae bacterium]|jgi:D-alanyl-D-alanine carboxypeptidase/D-alanyl-D-alanine-endopeptidase (penicillin-binding protein 4)|nr:D-alanyl-D-alanine carboxypeptidase/D-alanyl-D-alanine-endopeptidase [Marinifilaceae bacterium]